MEQTISKANGYFELYHKTEQSNNTNLKIMKYRVHRIDVKQSNMQEKLEDFINNLNGEVISVIPNVKPTFQLMGATAKVDFILVVEKIRSF